MHSYVSILTRYITWLIHVWLDTFIRDRSYSYVTWLVHMWHDSFICDALICDMTHSYVTWLIHMWPDSFICDMTHSCDMTRSYVTWLVHMWHDSSICIMTHSCMTWLVHMWHDSFICDVTHSYVIWRLIELCHITQKWFVCHQALLCDMTCVTRRITVWHDPLTFKRRIELCDASLRDMTHSPLSAA